MKIAGVVILYYPDKEISSNILSYLPYLDQLYIIDNSEIAQEGLIESALLNKKEVIYYNDNINHGIAESLNKACRMAIINGYDWLLTMDQDSYFEVGELSRYIERIIAFKEVDSVSMFGARYYTIENFKYDHSGYQDVHNLITSGSIINLKHFEKLGGFDEKLFIDEVDHEYCYKSIIAGLRIVLVHTINFKHQLGVTKTYWSIFTFSKTKRALHSPVRLYYMVRNYLYMLRMYKQHFSTDLIAFRPILRKRIINSLLFSNQQIKVIKYLLKAILDFNRGKMGKLKQ